jgi:hypothetical protein
MDRADWKEETMMLPRNAPMEIDLIVRARR